MADPLGSGLPMTTFQQADPATQPPPVPITHPDHPDHPLLKALVKGAHILGQKLGNVANPQLVFQNRMAQQNQNQQDTRTLFQSRIQSGIDNPNTTPEVRQMLMQLQSRIAGGGAQPTAQESQEVAQSYYPAGQSAVEKQQGAEKLQTLKNQGVQAKQGNARPVPYYAGAVNLSTAANMQGMGIQFNDVNGQPIDLDAVGQGNILVPIYEAGGKSYWSIATDKGRYETGDNQRKFEPAVGGPNPEAPSAGVVRVPTERTSTATSPGGAQVVTGTSTVTPQVPRSSRSPVAPGQQGTGAPVPPGEPPNPTLKTRTPVSSKTPHPGKTQSILPDIQNMTPQNASRAQKAQPAVTALLGLYGDPATPGVKSMADFAPLAADPHAQKVLGEAFKLLDQDMGEISDPGVIATLGTAMGWANFRAQAEAKAQRNAGTQMTDEEKEYFDTAIASMADIIGSRAATGQSPARFSVKAIQNELPLIGTASTTDPQSYLTKMGTIARQIEVGLNAMPDNSRALSYLNKRRNDLIQQSNQFSKKLSPSKNSPSGAKKWSKSKWKAANPNGDVNAAVAAAQASGRTVVE